MENNKSEMWLWKLKKIRKSSRFLAHRCSWNPGSVTACSCSAPVHRRSVAGRWTARSAASLVYPTLETRLLSKCPRSCKWHTDVPHSSAIIYPAGCQGNRIELWISRNADSDSGWKRLQLSGKITRMSLMVRIMPLAFVVPKHTARILFYNLAASRVHYLKKCIHPSPIQPFRKYYQCQFGRIIFLLGCKYLCPHCFSSLSSSSPSFPFLHIIRTHSSAHWTEHVEQFPRQQIIFPRVRADSSWHWPVLEEGLQGFTDCVPLLDGQQVL